MNNSVLGFIITKVAPMTNTKLLVVGICALLLSHWTNAGANPLNNSTPNSLNISVSYLDENSSYQTAALQFLPRYQGAYSGRTQSGGKDTVCPAAYKYTCKGTNDSGGSGSACKEKYTACNCKAGYKWKNGTCAAHECDRNTDCTKGTGGTCTANKCTYEVIECNSTKDRTSEKTTCGATVAGYQCDPCTAQKADGTQTAGQYNCICAAKTLFPNGSAGSGSGGILMEGANYGIDTLCDGWHIVCPNVKCKANYYYVGGGCKPCGDGYYSASGATSCTKCDTKYKYTCAADSNKHIKTGSGSSCSGKYAECQCDNELYSWDAASGSCIMGCNKNSCSSSPIQKTSKTSLAVLQQADSNIASIAECTPSCSGDNYGYTVTDCKAGYKPNSSGSGCEAYTQAELCDIHNSVCAQANGWSREYYFANKALTCIYY